jgi:hypothetical protein
MTETLPKNGTRVHVEFDGKVCGNPRPGDWMEIVDSDGIIHKVWPKYRPDIPVHKVLESANWPPVPGDIWKAGEREFFAYTNAYSGDVYLHPCTSDSGVGAASQTPAEFRELNPSLVRRRNV